MRILIIILWLILGLIYFWLWNRGVDVCCNQNAVQSEEAAIIQESKPTKTLETSTLPLAFYWEKSEVIEGDNFKAYKDSIIATLADGKILEITGYYYEGEKNNTGEENLGLARAKVIRELFKEIPDDRIRLFGKKRLGGEDKKDKLFGSSAFASATNNENVKEIDHSARIYFAYNSTRKIDNPKIDAYLDDVAKAVIKTGDKVLLTGHTDNIGPDDVNYRLGLKRAQVIKDLLIAKGVPADQIIVKSKGEKEPLLPNTTAPNRAENRRVELKILKQ